MKRYHHIGWLILSWLACSGLNAATLQAISVRQALGKTALYFSLSEPVHYRVFTLVNPNRVVVDFENTHSSMKLSNIRVDPRYIKTIRGGQPVPGTLRLVLEMAQNMTPHTSGSHQKNFSLELAVKSNQQAEAARRIQVAHTVTGKSTARGLHPVIAKHQPSKTRRTVVVVLDPGHGGKDPGAHGPKHTFEKDVVLGIAKQLKAKIDAQPGMRAVLTRKGDYYIGLRQRLNIARRYNADVFVSIHADAYKNPLSHGASVFALSQSGATSEAARWLAEKENYSELGGVNLSGLDDKNGLVRTVLIDLSQTATVGASLHMGTHVLSELNKMTPLHKPQVEQARFVVLKSPDIPSILIETGFISNPYEENNLKSRYYQERLSQSIFKGLKRYFWDYPPQGTLVEQQVMKQGNIF